jgi:hypothetical protein
MQENEMHYCVSVMMYAVARSRRAAVGCDQGQLGLALAMLKMQRDDGMLNVI